MIIYDEYGSKSYFFFDCLSEKEKQEILRQDYEEELEKEKQERIAKDGYEEFEYQADNAA